LNAIGGHELIHKKEWYNKAIGTWAYTKFMYTHFLDEHIKGHHKHIATPEDPATARKNESLWTFLFRSSLGQITKTWKREVKRIKKENGDDVTTLAIILYNKMTWCTVLHSAILLIIYVTLGWQSLKHQIVYSCFGIFFLELINYIEHYGILRSKDQNGIYESVNKYHSWNSLSSPVLFRL
jgi:alkane 1-monooxygenase